MKNFFLPVMGLFLLISCNTNSSSVDTNNNNPAAEPEAPRIGYSILNVYPHDTTFFTEGLEFHDGQLFESSGSGNNAENGKVFPSAFGVVNLKTGKVDKKAELNNTAFFGEGITFFNGKVYQLTYKTEKGFVYDAKTFQKLQEFSYKGEGWSLTHDSTRLIMSDGTSNLRFLDPNTLKVQSILGVTDNNGPVSNINELEFINGFIYSNQWQTNYILKIDPSSGKVVGKMDLSNLEKEIRNKYPNADVLNGIAYDAKANTLYVTGKCWPSIYEIRLN